VPNGVITFRRRALPDQFSPKWSESKKGLAPMHLTTGKRIEDIDCVLQVNILILPPGLETGRTGPVAQ